jgi:hypothetical protein
VSKLVEIKGENVNLISTPDRSNDRFGVRYAPRSGAHSQANGMWAPVAQRQNKRRGGGRGTRDEVRRGACSPPKSPSRSDLRGAEATGRAAASAPRAAASARHHRRPSSSTSTPAQLLHRHGKQRRCRIINRRYSTSFPSLSLFPSRLDTNTILFS